MELQTMYFLHVASLIQHFICAIYPFGTWWFICMVAYYSMASTHHNSFVHSTVDRQTGWGIASDAVMSINIQKLVGKDAHMCAFLLCIYLEVGFLVHSV